MARKFIIVALAALILAAGCATISETPAIPTEEEKAQVIATMTKGFTAVAAGMITPEGDSLRKEIDLRNLSYSMEFSSFSLLGSSPITGTFTLHGQSDAESNMVMDIRDGDTSLLIKGRMEDIGDSKVQHVSELRLNGKLLDASFLNG